MELATYKQLNFIEKLAAERQTWASANLNLEAVRSGTIKEASDLISTLLSIPREVKQHTGAIPFAEIKAGSYWTTNGQIARVRKSRTTGRLYAEILNDANVFVYDRGAVFHLKARMTLDEAKSWGVEHGICCICAKLLTDPKSIAAGIGPVCATRV